LSGKYRQCDREEVQPGNLENVTKPGETELIKRG